MTDYKLVPKSIVDELAQFIREVDGNHSMGAGALAEKICERFHVDASAINIVATKNKKGQIVSVTLQDEDHRILEVIAEADVQREPPATVVTDEMIEALHRILETAMKQTLVARIPECGEFSGIAQDAGWLLHSLKEMRNE